MNIPTRLDSILAKRLFHDVDNFLFDFDGVICSHHTPINGSVACINRLKELGKKCYFVSNNSTITRDSFVKILSGLGINNVVKEEIVCPAWVLAGYLKSINFKDKVYVIGTHSIGEELDKVNIRHFGIGNNIQEYPDPGNVNYNFMKIDPEVKAVVIGFDYYFNYPKIVEATTYVIKNPGCLFIATHDDPRYSGLDQRVVIPGTGTLVNSVATSVGYKPLILGKPNEIMWKILQAQDNLDPSRTCMIGDNLFTDIAFASNCSLGYSLAVLTGVTNELEISNFANDPSKSIFVPKLVTKSLDELKNLLNDSFME